MRRILYPEPVAIKFFRGDESGYKKFTEDLYLDKCYSPRGKNIVQKSMGRIHVPNFINSKKKRKHDPNLLHMKSLEVI